ncbi:MAG TPA: ATPase, T2SS/T4P/T4SS family, partial [Methylomirabilota bacterium]|nr:ATPase, T2SS/T4P/T4SS family [Methylomirabilota bacterium]
MAQPVKLGQPVNRRLGDLLVADGLLTAEQLKKALAEQKGSPEKIGSVLVRLNFVNEDQLIGFLSRQYGVPSITLAQLDIESDVLKLVPAPIARKYEVIPVRKMGNSLALAMADPTNVFALDDISFMTNLQVLPLVASQTAIKKAIDRNYESKTEAISTVLLDMQTDLGNVEVVEDGEEGAKVDVFELKESADEAPVVKLVNMVLVDAIQKGASDIHFESYEKIFRIRFRMDGVLHEMLAPPKRLESAILSRLKIMSNLDIAERRMPQDGRIKLRYNTREIDFRVSTLPTIFGEKAVLRILDKDALKLDMTQLGFDEWSLEKFSAVIRQPYGMVLITGPTGSGKTTTLYSTLKTLATPEVNVCTIEDPIEMIEPAFNQMQVQTSIELGFAEGVRALMRQDPDIIMVGEIRDIQTAEMAVQAALTGHLVLSTLHTNDSASAITRLLELGVPAYLLNSTILGVMAQRLVRT